MTKEKYGLWDYLVIIIKMC